MGQSLPSLSSDAGDLVTLLAWRTLCWLTSKLPIQQDPPRLSPGPAGAGCCVFNGVSGCAEAAPLKICRRAREGGVDVAIGRAVLTSLGTAGICSRCRAACQSPELAGAAAKIRRRFFGVFFIFIFWESWREVPGSQIVLAEFLLNWSRPWSLR